MGIRVDMALSLVLDISMRTLVAGVVLRAKFVPLILLCRPLSVYHATTLMVWKLLAQHTAVGR